MSGGRKCGEERRCIQLDNDFVAGHATCIYLVSDENTSFTAIVSIENILNMLYTTIKYVLWTFLVSAVMI